MRVPEGALDPFDVALMKLSAIPQFIFGEIQKLGGLPGLVIAGGVQIESPGINFFTREVDLAFPKPPDAPDGAIYFILRKLSGPDGRVAYESLDYGVVEGEGADAKVVTASPPFSGYLSDMNAFGLDGMSAVGGQMVNHAILAWAVDQALPGRPIGGVVTGKVLRTVWMPGASVPTYEPVAGALVSGVDIQGNPLFAGPADSGAPTVAVSQADGTYALFDTAYTGGPVIVSATVPGAGTVTAVAYEANPQDTKSPGLRFARHIATANLTYPAVQPPQAPTSIGIVLTRTVDGVETVVSDGVVLAGTPIGARFQILTDDPAGTSLVGASVNGEALPVLAVDAAQGLWALGGTYTPAQPGVYTVVASARPPVGGVISATVTFRAIAPGGGVSDPLPDDPPVVIDGRTAPRRDAVGVPVTVFPQVTFSEPVVNVPAGVSFVDASGAAVPFVLLGVGPSGPVSDVQAATPVTSLTIQPLTGLTYGTRYTLRLSADITDLDEAPDGTPARKALVPYETSFTTFAPEGIGQTTERFTSGGLAIVGDRAYVAQNEQLRSTRLRLFDVSDPVQPVEITGPDTGSFQLHRPPPVHIIGNPVDLAVEGDSPVVDGGRLLAVATNPFSYPYHPANVRLYRVTDDQQWHWIGAVTLGKDPIDGMIRRVRLRGTRLYALAIGQGKGVHVIDLPTAVELFDQKTGGEEGAGFYDLLQAIGTEGRGFGETAIVQSVFIDTGTGLNSLMHDLAVPDLTVDGITQPIAVVTGRVPLAVVNPQTGALLYTGPILDQAGVPLTSWGFAIEAGAVHGRPIALVSALRAAGGSDHAFVVVDLTDPANPRALATLSLPGSAYAVSGILLQGTTAYVGTDTGTYVVSLDDLTQPRLISTLTSVGGRLALSEDGLLFGSMRSPSLLQHELGGVRSAAFRAFYRLSLLTEWLDQDLPTRDHYGSDHGLTVLYGGATPESADNLRLTAKVVSTAPVVSVEWRAEGDGAELYRPPDGAALAWDIGDIAPVAGHLTFLAVVHFADGQTLQTQRSFEVGIRTTDLTVIGWIDPTRVPLDMEGVSEGVLKYFPTGGATELSIARKALTFGCLLTLSAGLGRPCPGDFSQADRHYILSWMFRFAANECPDCPPQMDVPDVRSLERFATYRTTSYKVFNRLQVKYRLSGGQIVGRPAILARYSEIGVTPDPIFGSHIPGEAGPANSRLRVEPDGFVSLVNDGTPDANAVRAFNTLMSPLMWSHIGSRIDLGGPTGAEFAVGLDPVWWTSSERRIRCPQWRKREADGLVGGSRMNSSSRPFAWCSTKARASRRLPAISTWSHRPWASG